MSDQQLAAILGRLNALYVFYQDPSIVPTLVRVNTLKPASLNDLDEMVTSLASELNNPSRFANRLNQIAADYRLDFSNGLPMQLDTSTLAAAYKHEKFIWHYNGEIQDIQSCELLISLRQRKKITVKEFAAELGVNFRNVAAWEKHKRNFNRAILDSFVNEKDS